MDSPGCQTLTQPPSLPLPRRVRGGNKITGQGKAREIHYQLLAKAKLNQLADEFVANQVVRTRQKLK